MKRTEVKKLDVEFSKSVRSRGRCELKGKDSIECKGILQTMHIISRRYRATRWLEDNALSGCSAHHFYYTDRPEEWRALIDRLFPGLYDKLWKLAWNKGQPI